MTLNQALSQGLQVTVVGLLIVFSVLIILMLVMMLMKVVFYNPTQPKKKNTENIQSSLAEKPDEKLPATTPAVATAPDEGELIAVLTAAIAASMNTSTYNLKIKSYRRVDNTAPAWNKAGLRDVIDARF